MIAQALRTAGRHAAPAPILTPQSIGRAATLALHDELALSPKPGLVTLTCQGSHADMDAHTCHLEQAYLRALEQRYPVALCAMRDGYDG